MCVVWTQRATKWCEEEQWRHRQRKQTQAGDADAISNVIQTTSSLYRHTTQHKQNQPGFKHLREQCLLFSLFVSLTTKDETSGMVCPWPSQPRDVIIASIHLCFFLSFFLCYAIAANTPLEPSLFMMLWLLPKFCPTLIDSLSLSLGSLASKFVPFVVWMDLMPVWFSGVSVFLNPLSSFLGYSSNWIFFSFFAQVIFWFWFFSLLMLFWWLWKFEQGGS